jgi:hypothetical protein
MHNYKKRPDHLRIRRPAWQAVLLLANFFCWPSVARAGGAAELLAATPFEAGVAVVGGNYAFTHENYLIEGAKQLQRLHTPAIFIYLTNKYQEDYPDKGAGLFGQPTTLTELAASPAYSQVFGMPFKAYVITTLTFANGDAIFGTTKSQRDVAASERAEVHDLAKYLYTTYKGSHKLFILKNWETDWFGLREYDPSKSITSQNIADLENWLKARQEGVAAARAEAGDPDDVAVLHAVEVNRPLDWLEKRLPRVLNAVVPAVGADMITYSSYDATTQAPATMVSEFQMALDGIDRYAPDPLGLGRRRVLISEYGLFENEHAYAENDWRLHAILDTASDWGTAGAFLWELYDNECKLPDSSKRPLAVEPGDPARPGDRDCRGLWLVKPDGLESVALNVLEKYWKW